MRGTPYGQTDVCALAFCLAHPARRFAIQHAARHGHVHALHIQREFSDYNRTAARDILHVLRDRGVMQPGERIPDVQGKRTQLTYVITPAAAQAVKGLLTVCQDLDAALSPTPEVTARDA